MCIYTAVFLMLQVFRDFLTVGIGGRMLAALLGICLLFFKTRREYLPIGSTAASLLPKVLKSNKQIPALINK